MTAQAAGAGVVQWGVWFYRESAMAIELTPEQSAALAADPVRPATVIDPGTRTAYRLVPADVYTRFEKLTYDDSPWTPAETTALAAAAFARLDDTDYGPYLAGGQ